MRLSDRSAKLVGQIDEVFWQLGYAAWHPDGRLLVPGGRGLWSVSTRGDAPSLLIPASSTLGRIERVGILPDGRLALTVRTGDSVRLEVTAPDGTDRRAVASGLEAGAIVDDVMVVQSSGQWRATRLDPSRLTVTGSSVPVPDLPASDVLLGRSIAVIAGNLQRELVWVSRSGVVTPVGVEPGSHAWPRLSPDGSHLTIGDPSRSLGRATSTDASVWAIDLRTRSRRPLAGFTEPVWTHDSRRVITSLGVRPNAGLGEQIADGSRRMDTLFKASAAEEAWPTDVSRDGNSIVFYGAVHDTLTSTATLDLSDIYVLDRRSGKPRRLRLPGLQRGGRLSPNGRWLAYQSVEKNGRGSVHVRPFPTLDADYVVSGGEGEKPAWSADGRELFFRRGRDMMVVPVQAEGTTFETPAPAILFTGNFIRDASGDQDYDVAADGRFLMMRPVTPAESSVTIRVTLNWLAELQSKLNRGN
jgi:hypothetical protein